MSQNVDSLWHSCRLTDELISIENAVITIMGAESSKWEIKLFFFFCA